MSYAEALQPQRRLTMSYRTFLNGFLWVFLSLGSFRFLEPSPYDILSLLIGPLWLVSGCKIHRSVVPLVFSRFSDNIVGFFSLVPLFNGCDPQIVIF